MSVIYYCDGCGRTWKESKGEVPPPNHGHTPWYLLALPIFGIVVGVVVALLVA